MSDGSYGFMGDDNTITGVKQSLGGKVEGQWMSAEAGGISYGLPVFTYLGERVKAYKYHNDTGKLVFDADFITANSIVITVNGESTDPVVFATDHDTTAEAVRAAIAGLAIVDACVLDTADTNTRTFLIQVKGAEAVVSEAITLGSTQATGTVTYGSSQIFIGVAMRVEQAPSLSSASNLGYEYQDSMAVIAAEAEVSVKPNAAVLAQGVAYVVTTAGDDLGQFGAAGVAVNALYRENGSDGVNTRLEVKGHTSMTYASSF